MTLNYPTILLLFFITLLSQNVFALKVNDDSPNLFGRTLDGELFRLLSVPGPKVVNFFWVECQPCRKEMPELAKLEKVHSNVKFISVHISEKEEEPVDVITFLSQLKAAPNIIVLSSPMVKERFDFIGLPHTLVLDQHNKIKAIIKGYSHKGMAKLKSALRQL